MGGSRGQAWGALNKEGSPRQESPAFSGKEAHDTGRQEHTGWPCNSLLYMFAGRLLAAQLHAGLERFCGWMCVCPFRATLGAPSPLVSLIRGSTTGSDRSPQGHYGLLALLPGTVVCGSPAVLPTRHHALFRLWLPASPPLQHQLPGPCSTQGQVCHASNAEPPGNPTEHLPLAS